MWSNLEQRDGTQAVSVAKKPRFSPESGISHEVNDLLSEGEVPQDKPSESQDDVLGDVA